MKKVILLLLSFTIAISLNAQTKPAPHLKVGGIKNAQQLKKIDTDESPTHSSTTLSRPPFSFSVNKDINSVNKVLIGHSANPNSYITSNQTVLSSNQDLNLITFTHRKSITNNIPGTTTNASGACQTSFSTNGGMTWDSTLVPWSGIENALNAGRYPSGVIYNPTGNTTVSNAYAVVCGPKLTVNAAPWVGNFFASESFGHTNNNKQINVGPLDTVYARNYLQSCDGGTFHVVGERNKDNGVSYTQIQSVRYDGVWNNSTNTVDWMTTIHNPPFTRAPNGEIRGFEKSAYAWSKNGQVGYHVYVGIASTAMDTLTYAPIVYKTTDAGTTWNLMTGFNYSTIPSIEASLIQNQWRAFFSAPLDVAVDINNNLHIVSYIYNALTNNLDSLSYYQSNANFQGNMFDVYTTTPTGGWNANYIGTQYGKDVSIPYDFQWGIGWDNRLHISKSPDASKLFYIWLDSDTINISVDYLNRYPDVLALGYDVNTGVWTDGGVPTNFTKGTVYDGSNYFMCASDWAFGTGCSFTLHISTMELGSTNSDPVNHYFLSNAGLSFITSIPVSAGAISGITTACLGQNSVTYTVPPIANACSYVWTLPSGVIGTSTTNSITVNFSGAAVSGNITVYGTNTYGNGSSSSLMITVNPLILPVAAGVIAGASNVTIACSGQNTVTYTVPLIANACSYVWILPSGVTGASNTNSIIVTYGSSAVSGNISVYGTNGIGNGTSSNLYITVNPMVIAGNAGSISGPTTVCQGQSSVTYVLPAIANACSYVWSLPSGAIGTSNTNIITVAYGSSAISGIISVYGTNPVGDGSATSLSITVNPMVSSAVAISGDTNVCQGQNLVTYTVPTITNATSYTWTLPNGVIGSSSTNSINVNFSLSFVTGVISVCGTNSCGNGIESSITANAIFPQTSEICYVEYDTLAQKNKVYWSSSLSITTDSIFIYRELTLGNWIKIGSELYSSQSFVDLTSNPMNQSYNYEISAFDSCSNESSLSSHHKTITLIKSYDQLSNSYGFNWSAYEGLVVPQYNIFGVEANGAATIIGTVPGNSFMYNYTNPNPLFLNYFVGFDAAACFAKVNYTVKSNYVNSVTAIIENDFTHLNIFPNPVFNELIIEMGGNKEKINFEIIDAIGQIVFKGNLLEKTVINTSMLSSGVYIIKLENGNKFQFKKLIKE